MSLKEQQDAEEQQRLDDEQAAQEAEDRGDVVDDEEEAEDRGDVVAGDQEEPEKETEDAPEEPDEPDKDDKPTSIPTARFNEVISERNWLREQLAAARGTTEPQPEPEPEPEPFDFKAKERDYMKAVYDGEEDKALEIRGEINDALFEQASQRATQTASAQLTEQQAREALGRTAAQVIDAYPFLNSESDVANEDAIAEVVGWRDMYMSQGKAPHEALQAAVSKVAPVYAEPEPQKEDTGKQRQAEAAKRNAQASNQQPPALGGVGSRGQSDTPNIEDMTDEEFDALSDKEKSRLRGDSA